VANLRQARRNFYAIAGILLVVDIVAAVLLFTSTGARSATLDEKFQQLRLQVQMKSHLVVPPEQVQERVQEARKQMAEFYKDRLASDSSALSTQLGMLAKDAGVKLISARYQEVDSDVPDLRQIRIAANIGGNYLESVKFINAVERSKLFFTIESVALGEQQAGSVRLSVNMDTYLKGGQ